MCYIFTCWQRPKQTMGSFARPHHRTPRHQYLQYRYSQYIHPIAPSAYNIATHQFTRLPQSILYLRDDTMSQLLSLSNVRPGGRYMVVDDTGGLITAAVLERMGCVGRIMTFTDADSPPAWGVLNTMNFGERELACVKWLNWFQAEEDYAPRKLVSYQGECCYRRRTSRLCQERGMEIPEPVD